MVQDAAKQLEDAKAHAEHLLTDLNLFSAIHWICMAERFLQSGPRHGPYHYECRLEPDGSTHYCIRGHKRIDTVYLYAIEREELLNVCGFHEGDWIQETLAYAMRMQGMFMAMLREQPEPQPEEELKRFSFLPNE